MSLPAARTQDKLKKATSEKTWRALLGLHAEARALQMTVRPAQPAPTVEWVTGKMLEQKVANHRVLAVLWWVHLAEPTLPLLDEVPKVEDQLEVCIANLPRETAHRWHRRPAAPLPEYVVEVVRGSGTLAEEKGERLLAAPLKGPLKKQRHEELLRTV